MSDRHSSRSPRPRSALACFGLCLLLSACAPTGQSEVEDRNDRSELGERLGGENVSGYARALEPREFVFPADHGPHPDYRNEWWYFTGNLATDTGRRFGYQVTFFRIALAPRDGHSDSRRSNWATRQIWMAHVALSDADNRRHSEHERFARGAAGLAGAQAEPFRVWLEDWQIQADPDETGDTWQLAIDTADFELSFRLKPIKPIILQGDAGLSQKSSEPGNASYYYSMTRLRTTGEIRLDGKRYPIDGLSWLDREWSTSALGEDQAGWDWFALQFDDGRDLMIYQLRRKDGGVDPHSAGTLIGPSGERQTLRAADVVLQPVRWWQSSDGARYPIVWHLALDEGPGYRVEAVFDDQRMDTSVRYWEGMVQVFDQRTDRRLGRGYLELAGYE